MTMPPSVEIGQLDDGNGTIVRRSVNGWTGAWLPEDFKNPDNIERFINEVVGSVMDDRRCPMLC